MDLSKLQLPQLKNETNDPSLSWVLCRVTKRMPVEWLRSVLDAKGPRVMTAAKREPREETALAPRRGGLGPGEQSHRGGWTGVRFLCLATVSNATLANMFTFVLDLPPNIGVLVTPGQMS